MEGETALDRLYRYFGYLASCYMFWLFYGLWNLRERNDSTHKIKNGDAPRIQVIPATPSTPEKKFDGGVTALFPPEEGAELKKVEKQAGDGGSCAFKLESPIKRKRQVTEAKQVLGSSNKKGNEAEGTSRNQIVPAQTSFSGCTKLPGFSDPHENSDSQNIRRESDLGSSPLLVQKLCDINRLNHGDELRIDDSYHSGAFDGELIKALEDNKSVHFADPMYEEHVFEQDSTFDEIQENSYNSNFDVEPSDESSDSSENAVSPDSIPFEENNNGFDAEEYEKTTPDIILDALHYTEHMSNLETARKVDVEYEMVYKGKLERLSIGDQSWSNRSSPVPFLMRDTPEKNASGYEHCVSPTYEPPLSPDRGYESFSESASNCRTESSKGTSDDKLENGGNLDIHGEKKKTLAVL